MLGKLIKHEFIADSKLLGPAYIVVLVLALLGRIMTWAAMRQTGVTADGGMVYNKALTSTADIIQILYALAIIALMIMTFVFLVYRFYKNFFTDEGYLMLTLPTKPRHLVFSKLVNYFIWMLFSTVVAIGSLWVIMSVSDQFNDSLKNFIDMFSGSGLFGGMLAEQAGVPLWGMLAELVVVYLAWAVQFVLICYFSVAFGQLRAKNHKGIGSVLSLLLFIIVFQIIIQRYFHFAGNHFAGWFSTSGATFQALIWFFVLLMVLISALLYWLTCLIMSRKVNLD